MRTCGNLDFYRLLSPFEGNYAAWMFVSEDKTEAFVAYFRVLAEANAPVKILRLKGLDPSKTYEIRGSGRLYGGDELMFTGITMPLLHGDFQSYVFALKARS
jgi:alpha-galactosidase